MSGDKNIRIGYIHSFSSAVIGAILLLLFGPFIGIFAAQYFNNLFE